MDTAAKSAGQLMPDSQAAGLQSNPRDVEENKDLAALSYGWILAIVVYYLKRDSPFVRFHAKQGIVLFILSIPIWLIPMVGQYIELLILALCVIGFLNAAQGQWKELPIIGPLARRDMVALRKGWKDLIHTILAWWRRIRHSAEKMRDAADTPMTDRPSPAQTAAAPFVTPVADTPPADVVPAQSDTLPSSASTPPVPPVQ